MNLQHYCLEIILANDSEPVIFDLFKYLKVLVKIINCKLSFFNNICI